MSFQIYSTVQPDVESGSISMARWLVDTLVAQADVTEVYFTSENSDFDFMLHFPQDVYIQMVGQRDGGRFNITILCGYMDNNIFNSVKQYANFWNFQNTPLYGMVALINNKNFVSFELKAYHSAPWDNTTYSICGQYIKLESMITADVQYAYDIYYLIDNKDMYRHGFVVRDYLAGEVPPIGDTFVIKDKTVYQVIRASYNPTNIRNIPFGESQALLFPSLYIVNGSQTIDDMLQPLITGPMKIGGQTPYWMYLNDNITFPLPGEEFYVNAQKYISLGSPLVIRSV